MAKFTFTDIKKALSDPKTRNPLIWLLVGLLLFITIVFTVSSGGEEESVPETPLESKYNIPDSVPLALADEPENDIQLIQDRLKEDELDKQRQEDEAPGWQDQPAVNSAEGIQAPAGEAGVDPVAAALQQRFAQAAQVQQQTSEPSSGELSADQKYRLEMYKMGLDPDTGRPLSELQKESAEDASGDSADVTQPAQEAPKAVRRSGGVSSLREQSKTGVTDMNGDDEFIYEDGSKPIKVMFAKDGKVRSGDRVTLRLLEDLLVDGILIPANTHLFATCSIGARFDIEVASIDINGNIYPLNYEAYDNDGLKGLYFPASQSAEQGKRAVQEAGQIAQSAISSSLTGISGQVAQSGITLARGNKYDRVEVTAGYTFYIIRKENGSK